MTPIILIARREANDRHDTFWFTSAALFAKA
jgi:hypothetical protein